MEKVFFCIEQTYLKSVRLHQANGFSIWSNPSNVLISLPLGIRCHPQKEGMPNRFWNRFCWWNSKTEIYSKSDLVNPWSPNWNINEHTWELPVNRQFGLAYVWTGLKSHSSLGLPIMISWWTSPCSSLAVPIDCMVHAACQLTTLETLT